MKSYLNILCTMLKAKKKKKIEEEEDWLCGYY